MTCPAAIVRETCDHRPRRSQQSRSTRPRAEVRASHRTHGHDIPNERRSYILDRRSGRATLTGEAVYREYVNRRKQRVARAEVVHLQAEDDFNEARTAVFAAWGAHPNSSDRDLAAVDVHEEVCRRRLHAADAELATAKCSADRLTGELVTVPVVSIYAARTWPNALPGGTSPQRATVAIRRAAFARARVLCAEATAKCAAIYGAVIYGQVPHSNT